MPTSLVLSGARLRVRRNAARSDAARRPRRRGCRTRRDARRRRRCWPAPAPSISATISSTPPGPPRYWPSPPESGRNSWRRKNSGKRTSVTSRLPNLMPPAACHSPPPGQPSPTGDAPPPGRAWNMCQMNGFRVRGSRPWMAMRNRRPQPGHRPIRTGRRQRLDDRLEDLLRAVVGAQRHRRAGHWPTPRVPGLAITSSGRNAPSFFGVCGSIR